MTKQNQELKTSAELLVEKEVILYNHYSKFEEDNKKLNRISKELTQKESMLKSENDGLVSINKELEKKVKELTNDNQNYIQMVLNFKDQQV